MNAFHLIISSVGETRFEGEAFLATMPGSDGEFTILAHHEPFVSTLAPGKIVVRSSEGGTKEFPVENGIVECSSNTVTILL